MTILGFSQSVSDFRLKRCQRHTSEVIVYIALAAVICEAQTWEDVALFGRCKYDYFKSVFPYLEEIPSHDTFNRFFSLLKPEVFEKEFRKWVRSVINKCEGVIAFDGKTIKKGVYDDRDRLLRGTYIRKGSPVEKLHIVSAWYADFSISLGQLKVEDKTNEITAIPELINELDILGCIITVDAMGCQKKIAEAVRKGGGDYVLALKGNQGNLHKSAAKFFERPFKEKEKHLSFFITEKKSHGRFEQRECIVCDNLYWLEGWKEWKDLKTFACIKSKRIVPGIEGPVTSLETWYYISSLELNAEVISNAIRTHWSIENNLHWQLDVTFNEDNDRKKNNAAQNFSIMAKTALALLKNDKTLKNSIRTKRKGAGWDNSYLHHLLSQEVL